MRAPGPITTCGVQHDAIADLRAGADHHQRTNRDVGAEARVRRDDRARMNAGRRPLVAAEHAQRVGKRPIGMRGAQHRAWRGRRIVGEDDCRGAGLRDQRTRTWIGEKGEIARAGVLDARHACDVEIAVAFEATVKPFGQIAKLHREWRAARPARDYITRSDTRRDRRIAADVPAAVRRQWPRPPRAARCRRRRSAAGAGPAPRSAGSATRCDRAPAARRASRGSGRPGGTRSSTRCTLGPGTSVSRPER